LKSAATLKRSANSGSWSDQQVVHLAIADQHHLERARQRLGLQRQRPAPALRLGRRLDADLARAQAALEAFPRKGLREQALGVEHQVAPIGAVQRPGADQVEVTHLIALLYDVLDAADQVAVARVVLEHHRRAL